MSGGGRELSSTPWPGFAILLQGMAKEKSKRGHELRRHSRFVADEANAYVSLKGFLSAVGMGRKMKVQEVVNLSESGLLLVVDQPLEAGKELKIRLAMERIGDGFQGEGVVRWSGKSAFYKDRFFLGIEFKGLGADQKRKLVQMRDWFTSPEYQLKRSRRMKSGLEFWK